MDAVLWKDVRTTHMILSPKTRLICIARTPIALGDDSLGCPTHQFEVVREVELLDHPGSHDVHRGKNPAPAGLLLVGNLALLNCFQKGGEGEGRRGGCTQFVHGRNRMTIRPSHLYYAGAEHVGFSRTRQTLPAPSAKRREVFGESHEG